MKKKLCLLMALALMVGLFAVPTSAAEAETACEEETFYVEGLGEVTVRTTTTVYDMGARSSTKTGTKTQEIETDGTVIATVTLKATFGYDGTDAWVISTRVTKSTSGGWSYGGQSIDEDEGTVTLTAKLTKALERTIPVELTMTCSPTGKIG